MSTVADPKLKPQPGAAVKPDAVVEKEAPMGEGAMAFISTSLNLTSRKKKDEKPEPKSKAKEGDDDELDELPAKPAAVAPPAKPAPKPRAQQTAAIDEDKLGEAVGRSVVKAMNERDKPAAPEKERELPPEVKSKLVLYERLAKQFPDKYKDHAKKFLANAQKFTEYSEQWERDHPGQEFDDTAAEHEAFRSTLEAETEYDEDDHVTALVREEKQKWRDEVDQEIKPLKERVKLADAEKDLTKAQADSTSQFWGDMAEEFPGVIDEQKAFNDAALRAAHEKDPASTNMAYRAASDAAFYARELHLLDNDLTSYLGEEIITERTPAETIARIHAHRFLGRRLEIEEAKAVSKERLDDKGRRFVPRAEYNKLSPEERAKVWTLTTEDCRYLLTRHIANEIRKAMKKDSPTRPAEGGANGDKSLPLKSQRQAAKPPEPEEELDEKPLSPTTPTAPRLASSRGKTAATSSEPLGAFATRGIHGR